jgi:hypothetical protein
VSCDALDYGAGEAADQAATPLVDPASPGQQDLEVRTPPGTCTKADLPEKTDTTVETTVETNAEEFPEAVSISAVVDAVRGGQCLGVSMPASQGCQLPSSSPTGQVHGRAAAAGEDLTAAERAKGGAGSLGLGTPLQVAAVPAAVACRDRPDSAPPSEA